MESKGKKGLSEDDTKRHYIDPVLKILGFQFRSGKKNKDNDYPDYYLFIETPTSNDSDCYATENLTVGEAKPYRVNLDRGDGRDELPPKQIGKYIAENKLRKPKRKWGLLTNGYKWRLYSIDGPDNFIEFDLEHLVEQSGEQLAAFALYFQQTRIL